MTPVNSPSLWFQAQILRRVGTDPTALAQRSSLQLVLIPPGTSEAPGTRSKDTSLSVKGQLTEPRARSQVVSCNPGGIPYPLIH